MSAPQAEAMAEPEKQVPTGTVRVDRDAALVAGLRRGEENATEHLLDTYGDRVYRLALRILGHPHDAEDAAQEILVIVLTHLSSFRGESAFTTWVWKIAARG